MPPMDIKTYRKAKGMTLEGFGALLGVTGATVQRWETGKVIMPLSKAREIQVVTGGEVTMDDLADALPPTHRPTQPQQAA
jgi:DNA-binding transcriptional regulator YiaG